MIWPRQLFSWPSLQKTWKSFRNSNSHYLIRDSLEFGGSCLWTTSTCVTFTPQVIRHCWNSTKLLDVWKWVFPSKARWIFMFHLRFVGLYWKTNWTFITPNRPYLQSGLGASCMWLEQYCPKLFLFSAGMWWWKVRKTFFSKKPSWLRNEMAKLIVYASWKKSSKQPIEIYTKKHPKITKMFTIFQLVGWIVGWTTQQDVSSFSWSVRLKSLNFLDNFCIWNDSPHWANQRIQEGLWAGPGWLVMAELE